MSDTRPRRALMKTFYTHTPSPIGPLLLMASPQGLSGLHMQNGRHSPPRIESDWIADPAPFTAAIEQLAQYFSGHRSTFDVALDLRGTSFQLTVWQGLREIPYGQTISYRTLAQHVGRPRAVRAVGLANGRNPVSIIVPCHRVIGADGSLTGYGGGLPRKKYLLELEAGAAIGNPDATHKNSVFD